MEISVIVTNYNYGKFLPRCIRSLVVQTYNHDEYEIIVIDDGSTDNSREIMKSSDRIRPIFNNNNMGLASTCNKAIKSALGKYVIRVDSDDYVHRDFLKMHHLFLANNKTDMHATSSDYYEVDLNEDIIIRKNGVTWPIACGIMYHTDHLVDIGMYDEMLPREDVELRQRFLQKYQIYNIPVPLYRYTVHKNSLSRGGSGK